MASSNLFQLPVSLNQILHLVKQLPKDQKNKLMRLLKKEVESDTIEVPEWQKKIVLERAKKSNPKNLLDWEKVKDSFKL